jgi:hypothetical protein
MTTAIRQLVVMADGEVRIPPGDSQVAHGHVPADQRLKIVMPADKRWLLVELQIEVGEQEPPRGPFPV